MSASKRPWRSYDLRFEISNLNYPGIHVQIASNGLLGHFPGTWKSFFQEPVKSILVILGSRFPGTRKLFLGNRLSLFCNEESNCHPLISK